MEAGCFLAMRRQRRSPPAGAVHRRAVQPSGPVSTQYGHPTSLRQQHPRAWGRVTPPRTRTPPCAPRRGRTAHAGKNEQERATEETRPPREPPRTGSGVRTEQRSWEGGNHHLDVRGREQQPATGERAGLCPRRPRVLLKRERDADAARKLCFSSRHAAASTMHAPGHQHHHLPSITPLGLSARTPSIRVMQV